MKMSHSIKVLSLWVLFVLACTGTYFLARKIEIGSQNMAGVFSVNGRSHEISLYSDRAEPTEVLARVGDEILFVVKDKGNHNISEERTQRKYPRVESGDIGKNESYSLVFQTPGIFYFYDRTNQDIRITVTIK